MKATAMRTRIEKKGYSIVTNFNGAITAKKGNVVIVKNSITAIHKELFGY